MFQQAKQVRSLSRRQWLGDIAQGIGGMALAWLLQREQAASGAHQPKHVVGPHFAPQAKYIINIFSPGGVSHVDTFDYKPKLKQLHGTELTGKGQLDTFFGQPGRLMSSPYTFAQHGQCGRWVSSLLPHLAQCVDDLTFIHTLHTKSSSHSPACFQMNTGFVQNGFPSMGAWLSYGLGTANDQLPTFVVLPDPRGLVNGGSNNWSQGFLPAEHQGTAFRMDLPQPITGLKTPDSVSPAEREAGRRFLAEMNRRYAEENPGESDLSARLASYELAARMQTSIPVALDFADESRQTRELYGIDDEVIGPSARNFLLARRLIERGVRFVQVYNGGALGSPRINWDAHENVKENHDKQALLLDRPCAALLQDLKRRGLLSETLVLWTTEFGRTPFSEVKGTSAGRDHHPHTFTCWLAGAGVKAGMAYGESDDVGYRPAEKPVSIYDLHATIMHLLGVDHERLSYYHNGIERRLTDVHGHVVNDILA